MSQNDYGYVLEEDKSAMIDHCDKIISMLGLYNVKSSTLNTVKVSAKLLKELLESLNTESDGRDYICDVTEKPIYITDCYGCETRSCQINVGFKEGPDPIRKSDE